MFGIQNFSHSPTLSDNQIFTSFDFFTKSCIIGFAPLAQLVSSAELIIRRSRVRAPHGAPQKT